MGVLLKRTVKRNRAMGWGGVEREKTINREEIKKV